MKNLKTCKPIASRVKPWKRKNGYHRCICWIDAFLKRTKMFAIIKRKNFGVPPPHVNWDQNLRLRAIVSATSEMPRLANTLEVKGPPRFLTTKNGGVRKTGISMDTPKSPKLWKIDINHFSLETHGDLGIPHDFRNPSMVPISAWELNMAGTTQHFPRHSVTVWNLWPKHPQTIQHRLEKIIHWESTKKM